MQHNRITIYSNGIADFQRVYEVPTGDPIQISIPVRQDHLADVLASFSVLGPVKIASPPGFQPANPDEGNLEIPAVNSLLGLAGQLSGAGIKITHGGVTATGRLLGTQQSAASESPGADNYSLVIQQGEQIKVIAVPELESLQFTDEVINQELQKALNRSIRKIKPDSTVLNLKLQSEQANSKAILQYTIPSPAWKISYRLLIDDQDNMHLHGHAIVDNHTDEDWADVVVRVVTGQPISFTTDLADTVIPIRQHHKLVQDAAVDAVELQEVMRARKMVHAVYDNKQRATRMDDEPDGLMMSSRSVPGEAVPMAEIDQANIEDAGEYCVYEAPLPVSIQSRDSAVIPVFQYAMEQSESILHYDRDNHPNRPFQTIRFHNSVGHSLGRGVCTIFKLSDFIGTCILPDTQQNEDVLLPHALETGVRIQRVEPVSTNRRLRLSVSNGAAVETNQMQTITEYLVDNNQSRPFQFLLDHRRQLDGTVEVQMHSNADEDEEVETDVLENGVRIKFQLLADDSVVYRVIETQINESRVILADRSRDFLRLDWIRQELVNTRYDLTRNPDVAHCIELQRQLDEVGQQAAHARSEIERLEKRQERLRLNMGAGGGQQQVAKWQNDLQRAEDTIVKLEEQTLPDLKKKSAELTEQLFGAIRAIQFEWNG